MIVVIPFFGHTGYTDALAEALNKFKGLGTHRLIVAAPTPHIGDAEEFKSRVAKQFLDARVEHVKALDSTPVRVFRDGVLSATRVQVSQQEAPNPPILWLEPDWIPTQPDWATTVSSAFYNIGGGQRVLAKWAKREDFHVGRGNAHHRVVGGIEPVGPAVFPDGYARSTGLITSINNQSAPWRERLQFELLGLRADTDLFSDLPGSVMSLFDPGSTSAPEPKVIDSAPDRQPEAPAAVTPEPEPAPEPAPEPEVKAEAMSESMVAAARRGAVRSLRPPTPITD